MEYLLWRMKALFLEMDIWSLVDCPKLMLEVQGHVLGQPGSFDHCLWVKQESRVTPKLGMVGYL